MGVGGLEGSRRALVFRFRGEFRSPLFRVLAQRPALTATFRPTSVTPEAATDLVRVRGPREDLEAVREAIARLRTGSRIAMLTAPTDDELLFFQTCVRPTDGGVSLEHVLLETLGPSATLEVEFSSGQARVSITAPAGSEVDRCFQAYVTALEPRFTVELERLSVEEAPAQTSLEFGQEQILLGALAAGYFDAKRRVGIRDLAAAAGRGKSAHHDALRDAVAALARADGQDHTTRHDDTLVFEFWGAVPRSAHYALLIATPTLSARADAIQVTHARAWQVVVAEGPASDLDRLQAEVERAPAPPIERLEVLSRTPGRLVYHDEWRRPTDPRQGVSMEHLLFDRVGPDAVIRTEFRHGACRVTCVGASQRLASFWREVEPRLGARFRVERVTSDRESAAFLALVRRAGYLDVPRTGSIGDVAREAGVGSRTASARVRAALRAAILTHVPGARARARRPDGTRLPPIGTGPAPES